MTHEGMHVCGLIIPKKTGKLLQCNTKMALSPDGFLEVLPDLSQNKHASRDTT